MYYRLELLPTADGAAYYKDMDLSSDNAGIDLYTCGAVDPADLASPSKPRLLDLGTAARLVWVGADASETDVHFWLCPRSSIYKTGLVMANSQGVIDKTYRGVLKAPIWSVAPAVSADYFSANPIQGSRLFQIVAPDMGWIKEVRIVKELPTTSRDAGGFGSTGSR
jgi:dUTPase